MTLLDGPAIDRPGTVAGVQCEAGEEGMEPSFGLWNLERLGTGKTMASKTTKTPKSKPATSKSSKSKAKTAKPAAKTTRAKAATAKTKATKSAPKSKAAAKPAAKKAKAPAKPAKTKAATKPAAKAAPKPKAKTAPAKPAAKKKAPEKKVAPKPASKTAGTKPSNAASKLMAAAKSRAEQARTTAEAKTAKRAAPAKAAKAEAPKAKSEPAKPAAPRPNFKAKEFVVYPAHGVGQILEIEEQEVAGHRLELFVINFDKEKMTLRVPTNKAGAVGMRKLSDANVVDSALETLRGRARIKRTMWSRRAQEYEAKINSGDLISIAEVVRDLYRSERQPEQSYSERQLYEAALDRMAREVAAVERIGEDAAIERVEQALQDTGKRGEKTPKSDDEASEAA
ncbi:CarD family transcriptional regulator [Parvibaculum sp.]|uniref:CarD family transcriptional regulator n=2 Tax=Parvibaculum sp. TaxID=2024848 RepID=UPI0025EE4CBB|nr:CarD family transcriptional regulator [Parvibaculum sp.]